MTKHVVGCVSMTFDGGVIGTALCAACNRERQIELTRDEVLERLAFLGVTRYSGAGDMEVRCVLEDEAARTCPSCAIERRKPTPEIRAARLRVLERRLASRAVLVRR